MIYEIIPRPDGMLKVVDLSDSGAASTDVFGETVEDINQAIEKIHVSILNSQTDRRLSDTFFMLRWIQHGWFRSLLLFYSSAEYGYVRRNVGEPVSKPLRLGAQISRQRNNHISGDDIDSANAQLSTDDLANQRNTLGSQHRLTVVDALKKRRTKRRMTGRAMGHLDFEMLFRSSLSNCNSVFWVSGRTDSKEDKGVSKTISFDYLIVVFNVSGFTAGLYKFDVDSSSFILIQAGDYRTSVQQSLNGISTPHEACFTVFICQDYSTEFTQNGPARSLRHLYIEAGRIAQSILVNAEVIGLHSLVTPAINDDVVSDLLRLSKVKQQALYSITVGF